MMNENDRLAQRAAQVEAEGQATYGEDNWKIAVRSLERRMADGDVSQATLMEKLGRPNAAAQIFNENIAEADEKSWRAWRDSQPRRARRIEKAR